MLHDKLYHDTINTIDGSYKGECTTGAYFAFEEFKKEVPVGFYFKEFIDDYLELADTASEFARNGLLKLPYNLCFFSVPSRKVGTITFFAQKVTDNEIVIFNINKLPSGKTVIQNCYGVHRLMEGETTIVPILECTDVGVGTGDRLLALSGLLNMCMMLLNHPLYEKEEHTISDSLNISRLKSKKHTLSNYIYIKLNERVRKAMETGKGSPKCPHWRRGHVRKLEDGRAIPVHACVVNWDGDPEDIAKKVYVV